LTAKAASVAHWLRASFAPRRQLESASDDGRLGTFSQAGRLVRAAKSLREGRDRHRPHWRPGFYFGAVWYDALDRFLELTNQPQSDATDWLVILIVCLGIAAKIYSIRRVVDLHREVALRRKAEAEAHQLARHDLLTGLPNRRWFIEDFDKWTCDLPEGEACALFVVDLDNFKPINDVYGHRLGDEVLKVVAKRLTQIAEGGSLARLGGDEFGIILRYRLDSNAPERVARRIVHEVSKPVPLAALALQVGVSVGVSTGAPDVAGNVAMAERDGTGSKRIGRSPRAAAASVSSTAAWTRNCGKGSSSKPRSAAPSPQVRSFPTISRSSISSKDGRLRGAGAMGASKARPAFA